MEIKVTYGTGEGPTELSAFDRALYDAGIANYNLIKLSSVIPPKSSIKVGKVDLNEKAHGDRLYVVLSEKRESRAGKEAWAGIGWVTYGKDKRGIFVEHHGESEGEVKKLILDSLNSMRAYRDGASSEIQSKIVGMKCGGNSASALVCAVYQSERW